MSSLKQLKKEIRIDKLPKHLAIIMDGNGRWAQKRLLPRIAGHQKGIQKIGDVIKWCNELQIKELTLFAFSTENWQRSKEEVNFLMEQATKFYYENSQKLADLPINIQVVGEKAPLDTKILVMIEDINRQFIIKKKNDPNMLQVNFAFNYGAKQEIWHSVLKIVKNIDDKIINFNDLQMGMLEDHLYVKTPVDLLIRTSGEMRVSNFLLWQLAYAELCFLDVYWPALSEKDLVKSLLAFQKRERRYGKEEGK